VKASSRHPAPHRSIAVTFTGNVLAFLAALAGGMITARALGPAGRGAFALLHTTPDLIISFVLMGIVQTNVCFVSQGIIPSRRMLGVASLAALFQSAAGFLLFAVAAIFFRQQFFGESSLPLIAMSAALIPLGILQAHWSSLLGALKQFKRLAFLRAAAPFILVFGYLILLVVLRLGVGGGLAAVLFSSVAVASLMLLSLVVFARAKRDGAGGHVESLLCDGFWKRYLTYGIKLHASALMWFLIIKVDIYMIKYFLDIESVGYFSLASSLAEKLWLVTTSANTVLLPSLASIADPGERARMAARASRQITIILLPFFFLGLFLGKPLIMLLYGSEFEPSAVPFVILLGSTLVQAHRSITASFFESSDLALVNVATRAAAFLLKILLNIALIPALLMQGAALSSLLAYSFEWYLGTRVFLGKNGLRWRDSIPAFSDAATVYSKLKGLVRNPLRSSGSTGEGTPS